jgi:transmembrane sensor
MHTVTDDRHNAEYRHPDPMIDQALEWVLKRQSGEVDQDALNAWLSEGADRGAALAKVMALYDCPTLTVATAQTAQKGQASQATQMAAVVINGAETGRRRWPLLPLALAASIAAALAVPLLGSDWLIGLEADYRTGAGEVVAIDLPDGSRMQMNSQTAVSLDFAGARRAVRLLEGEAFFEVAHDATRPFTVTAGYAMVKVTGTAFDVARGDEADVVHLESGRVMLIHDEGEADGVEMSPGQTASVDHSQIAFLPSSDSESRLAWREGWIQLSAVPLHTALSEIGRHTDLSIVTLPAASLNTPVSGSFRIDEAYAAIASVVTAAGAKLERLPGGILFIH